MSKHHRNVWAGPIVTLARNYWRRRMASATYLCPKCNKEIDPQKPWDVGHIIPLNEGGPIHLSNTQPEHSSCNRGDGARITNQIKRGKRSRIRKW